MKMSINNLQSIVLGREKDGGVKTIEIDCSEWKENFPQLTKYRIEVTSPNGIIYCPEVTMNEHILTWPITKSDTALTGKGAYQIVATGENDERLTSAHLSLNIYSIMPGTAQETPPEYIESWVQNIVDTAERAELAAKKAEDAAAGIVITPEEIQSAVNNYLIENPIEVEETDPTVPDWAKEKKKPTYTAEEVGALPADAEIVDQTARDGVATLSEEIEKFGNVEPKHDDIPRIFFGASIPQSKQETVMKLRYVSKTLDFDGYCETKAQGNSSMSYPKKNQTTKLFDDMACEAKHKIEFKGWGKQNKFCLKANWIDLTHARNVVSARLWGDVVKSRTGFDALPELMKTSPNYGAVDGFPVRVFAVGKYQGRYTLNIPKDKWMANMDDENPNHCILCGENYVSGCFRAEAKIDGSDWTDEVHDIVPDNIKTRWNQVINFVMTSTDDEFVAGLDDYIDVESAIDYYLFGLAICNLDGFGKNQLYLTYDGIRWYASAYDMDSTFGLYYDARGFVSAEYARTSFEDYISGGASGEGNLLYNRLAELFADRILSRWEELRRGALSASNIINRFEEFVEITPPHIVEEDYAETTADGAFINIPLKDTNNIQQIRAYAFDRLAYVHGYLTGETTETNLWSLKDKTEEPVGDVFITPNDSVEIKYGTYRNGVSGIGHRAASYNELPALSIVGDDVSVTATHDGTGGFGYGIAVPIELEPGETYQVFFDILGDGGCAVLMYYNENGVYQNNTMLTVEPFTAGTFEKTVTIPECAHVVFQASCNVANAETPNSGTSTFENIKIVKL